MTASQAIAGIIRRMSGTLRLRDSDLEWREVEGEIVALDLRRSNYLAVNHSGAKLWNLLVTGASREELVDHLVNGYGVSRDRAEIETDAFIQMLADQGVLSEK